MKHNKIIKHYEPNEAKSIIDYHNINHYFKNKFFYFYNVEGLKSIAISEDREDIIDTKNICEKIYLVKSKNFNNELNDLCKRVLCAKSIYEQGYKLNIKSAKDINYFRLMMFFIIILSFTINYFPNFSVIIINLIFLINNLFKLVFFIAGLKNSGLCKMELPDRDEYYRNIKDCDLPIYTVLVPLYNEVNKVKDLIIALKKIEYPKNKLDIKIILEEDDYVTRKAIMLEDLPVYFHVIHIPKCPIRTKPKALNYAMNFATGHYVVIYDAEDEPDKYQLKKAVYIFSKIPDDYVCLQAKLNFYNANDNILTKLFSLEYSFWFEFLIKGFANLKTPVTLGGTSNHFKIDILKKLELWDAHNVTEDADIGIKIANLGGKIGIIDSFTLEESPRDVFTWLYQRSRWIKGFIQTALVYSINTKYYSKLSFWNKLCVILHVHLSVLSFILFPVNLILMHKEMFFLDYIISINILIYFFIMYFIILKTYTRKEKLVRLKSFSNGIELILWPFYFILHSLAAYMAVCQIIINPFKWNKTNHGNEFIK